MGHYVDSDIDKPAEHIAWAATEFIRLGMEDLFPDSEYAVGIADLTIEQRSPKRRRALAGQEPLQHREGS